jgi:hypothetical protein
MAPEEIQRKRDALTGAPNQVRWCDDGAIDDENMEGAGPGGWLNVFGWYVVGTTIGGNAIVVRVDDPAVYYAGHEWYSDTGVDYEDFGGSGKGKWVSAPFTADGVRQSLFQLAPSIDKFREMANEIDALLDKID